MSSLHHEHRVRCLDTSLFDSDATMIAVARKALGKRARELNLHHEKVKRMPVTLDMVQWLRARYWKFLYDIFGWTTEQSPREQQLAVVIYNVCFLVLGGVPPIARRPWDLYYRSKNLARLQDSGKCNY